MTSNKQPRLLIAYAALSILVLFNVAEAAVERQALWFIAWAIAAIWPIGGLIRNIRESRGQRDS